MVIVKIVSCDNSNGGGGNMMMKKEIITSTLMLKARSVAGGREGCSCPSQ